MSKTLEVRDLSVLFAAAAGPRIGLPSVSFSVQGGECLAVLGASGSGKSSLLRTIAGLQPQDRGSIHVQGRDVSAAPPEQRSIVYLHQEPVLFPHLSVLENVAFPLTLRGVAKRDAHQRALAMLARLQVERVARSAATALSGGERHRVALARALCADPAVLLLDEPLSSLDPVIRRDVRAALLEARRASGAATILVTHDLDDAMAVGSHIAAIGPDGGVSQPTEPASLLHRPPSLTVARLLGVFAEVPGAVEQGQFRWMGGVLEAPAVPAGPAVACVRSHEVQVQTDGAGAGPELTVAGRMVAAHEVLLELRDDAGAVATLGTSSGTAVRVGDRIRIVLRDARLFSAS